MYRGPEVGGTRAEALTRGVQVAVPAMASTSVAMTQRSPGSSVAC